LGFEKYFGAAARENIRDLKLVAVIKKFLERAWI